MAEPTLSERLSNAAEGCLSLGYGEELYDLLKEAARVLYTPEDDPVVVQFPGQTLLGIAPGKITAAAQKADLKYCLILGVRRDATFYFASTDADVQMALWQLERAKRALFEEISPEPGLA